MSDPAISSTPDDEAKETDRVYKLVPATEAVYSAQKYIVDGIIPEGSLVSIFGDVGKGKTWVAIALAVSVAGGIDFFGRAVTALEDEK